MESKSERLKRALEAIQSNYADAEDFPQPRAKKGVRTPAPTPTESFGSTSENASGANNDSPGSTGSTSKPKVDGPTGSWTVEI